MNDHPKPSPSASQPGAVQAAVSSPRGLLWALSWTVANFEEVITALLLGIMIASVGLSVFFRYVLQKPFSWTEEVVLFCMVWMVFLGASMATKHREHIVIDFVTALVPKGLARIMEIVSLVTVIAVLMVMVWQGLLLVQRTQFMTTTALGIPTMYVYAAVPFSALLMIVHNLRLLFAMARER